MSGATRIGERMVAEPQPRRRTSAQWPGLTRVPVVAGWVLERHINEGGWKPCVEDFHLVLTIDFSTHGLLVRFMGQHAYLS